ncbi:MAG TPA: transposase, partial [Sutterellaceae bacterium]|nr:transposase [Sutterellaceae bacterium]
DLNRMDWLTKVFQITKEINWTFEPDLVQGQVSSKKTKESRYFTGTSISID